MLELARRSPADETFDRPGFSLQPHASRGWLSFRLHPSESAAKLSELLAFDLPKPGHLYADCNRMCLSFAPGHWLLNLPEADLESCFTEIQSLLTGIAGLVVDSTHSIAAFDAQGSELRSALSAFVPLDLRDRSFAVGDVARTTFGERTVVIARTQEQRFVIAFDQASVGYAVRLLNIENK